MSSDAQYAYDMGWTDELGGVPDFCYDKDYNQESKSRILKKYFQNHDSEFSNIKQFQTWQEASQYAKANPGATIVRCDDGNGWKIKN